MSKDQVVTIPHDHCHHPFSLKKAFGRRWKIKLEESWQHEKPENRNGCEGWYELVPTSCGGFIGLFQDKPTVILQFYTPKQRITGRKLAERFKDIPRVRLDDGFDDYEAVLYFPPELFEQVVREAGARKRRQLSEAHKEALAQGRERAGLVRDETGRIVHSQAQDVVQI